MKNSTYLFSLLIAFAFVLPVQAQQSQEGQQGQDSKQQSIENKGKEDLGMPETVKPPEQDIKNFGQGETFTEIIKNDHELINWYLNLFLTSADKAQRTSMFDDFKEGVQKHMSAEEEYIYPVLEKDDKIKGDAVKARDQHAAAQAQLDKVDPNSDDATFKAQVSVLRELIEDHVQYEEDKLLSRAEQIISPEDQKRINEDFKQSYSDGGWF